MAARFISDVRKEPVKITCQRHVGKFRLLPASHSSVTHQKDDDARQIARPTQRQHPAAHDGPRAGGSSVAAAPGQCEPAGPSPRLRLLLPQPRPPAVEDPRRLPGAASLVQQRFPAPLFEPAGEDRVKAHQLGQGRAHSVRSRRGILDFAKHQTGLLEGLFLLVLFARLFRQPKSRRGNRNKVPCASNRRAAALVVGKSTPQPDPAVLEKSLWSFDYH